MNHSKSRRGRQSELFLSDALILDADQPDQECEVDGLLGIEPRIANRMVAVVEILIRDLARAPPVHSVTFWPGHLQMHATRIGALRRMDLRRRISDFLEDDPVKRAASYTRTST